jgi:SAM-dependent methyltransferase
MRDVFGKVMEAAYRGLPSDHQIERDDGFVNDTNGDQYVAPVSEWVEAEREAIRHARGRVLDVGCGAGRVLVYLQEQGLNVTGIDVSPRAVRVCRRRGIKNVSSMPAEDLRFPRGSFDTVVLFGNNFGIMGTPESTMRMFRDIERVASPNGIVLASSRDPKATEQPAHIRYHARNTSMGLPPGQVKIRVNFRGESSDWFGLLLSSPEEMEGIVSPAGWRIDNVFGPRSLYTAVLRKR